MLIGEACRFYGWSFEECWKMPARRFFAMVRAAQRIRAHERLEELDLAVVSVGGSKLYDVLRDKYMARYEQASGFKPTDNTGRLPAHLTNADLTPEQKVDAAMEQFAYLKRLSGYGG